MLTPAPLAHRRVLDVTATAAIYADAKLRVVVIHGAVGDSADCRDGRAALMEKRQPRLVGR